MNKVIRKVIWAAAIFIVFIATEKVFAASFYLEPSSGNIIRGCTTQIKVKMSTEGQSSNGAQVYATYTSLGGGSISIDGAGLFSTYGVPPGTPAQTLGLFGYGGVISGTSLDYATINVLPGASGAFSLNILFNAGEITSKIAADPSSENILTSVANGSYIVADGYCETQPPYLTNLNPVADKPNHPVGQNIIFDVKDDGSGLDMTTFSATVEQNGVILPTNITQTANGTDNKWYSIIIDPVNSLTPEMKVVVNVSVMDKAGNLMTRTYQFNDLTCAQLGCSVSAIKAQCEDGADNDYDGKVDFPEDSGCAESSDNNEYAAGDFVCASTTPVISPVVTTTVPQCSDLIDNDNDGLIDMADPGCDSSVDNNEYVFGEVQCPTATPTPVVEISGEEFGLANMKFFLANRSVPTQVSAQGIAEVLSGTSLTLAADLAVLNEQILSAVLMLGEKQYALHYDNGLRMYAVDVLDSNVIGQLNAALVVGYGNNKQISVPFAVSFLHRGSVVGKDNEGKIIPIVGSLVKLEQLSAGKYTEAGRAYTDASGNYGFVVPNGDYRLSFEATGYRTEKTSGFRITNHVVNRSAQLITAVDLLAADVSIGQKAEYVASVAEEQAVKIIESANDPQVEKTAESTVAPIALGTALIATVPALSMLNLFSYLRFLFLQPIFLVGYRRRKKWGMVYNALTKLPIDLAVVRLYDAKTNRMVQSHVTDSEGRYAFFVDPGLYRIEVIKPGFIFPTKILQDYREDTNILDLYHGEPVHVDEKYAAIAANIPLDPVGVKEKTPLRIAINKMLRGLQRFIASLSVAAGILAVIIRPTWWTIGLLAFQVILYFVFKRLATPPKPKNWGIVYDRDSNRPVGRVVARLFSKQFNKLVATGVTDNKGRYSFMVGPNDYYITFEKNGYNKAVSPGIKIKEKHEVVKVDMPLEKSGSTPTASSTPPTKPIAKPPAPPVQPFTKPLSPSVQAPSIQKPSVPNPPTTYTMPYNKSLASTAPSAPKTIYSPISTPLTAKSSTTPSAPVIKPPVSPAQPVIKPLPQSAQMPSVQKPPIPKPPAPYTPNTNKTL